MNLAGRGAGVVLCLMSAVAFGTAGVFGKLSYGEGLEVTGVLAARFTLAAAVLWGIVAAGGPRLWPSRRGLVASLLLGAVVYAAMSLTYFWSLSLIDASLTILLAHIAPVFVALGAWAFGRERLTREVLVSLPIAVAGTALIAIGAGGGEGDVSTLGIVLAIVCALTYAAYMLLSHAVVERVHPFLLSAALSTGCAVTFGAAAVARGELPSTGGVGWLIIIGLALISTVVAVTTLAAGTGVVGPSAATLLSTMEPVTATALAFSLLGERLTVMQVAGAVLVIGSVLVIALPSRRAVGSVAAAPPDPPA